MRFQVSLTFEIEEGAYLPLVVFGTRAPSVPANRRGHPDTWTPAEGGEIEIEKIRSGHMLTPEQTKRLTDSDAFMRAVEAEVDKMGDR